MFQASPTALVSLPSEKALLSILPTHFLIITLTDSLFHSILFFKYYYLMFFIFFSLFSLSHSRSSLVFYILILEGNIRRVVGWVCLENQEPGTSCEEEEKDEGEGEKRERNYNTRVPY